jgi:DNA repair ATPase RecN
MLGTYMYKHSQTDGQALSANTTKQTIAELKEVVGLKRVWGTNQITKKLKKLQKLIPEKKVEWSKRSKKITAVYKNLTANELNALTTKILNLPILIRKYAVKKVGNSYNVEFKCAW